MKIKIFLLIVLFTGCKSFIKEEQTHPLKKGFQINIMFNHLSVVLDDSTYNCLFDSLKILDDFSSNIERTVDSDEDSWTHIYLRGKNHYVEISKPNEIRNKQFGDLGIAFMTNKLGTLDSVHKYWSTNTDSIWLSKRVLVEDGESFPWFRSLVISNPKSLQIGPWLMENEKDLMIRRGFTEEDLLQKIEYWDYIRYRRAERAGTSPDSVRYEKAFDKVSSLHLALSKAELAFLRQYLFAFGFIEKNNSFTGKDVEIYYTISNSEHFILKQIDFSLLDSLPNGKHHFRNLEFSIDGNMASLKFKFDKEI